jgi:uncharacterized membrane protein
MSKSNAAVAGILIVFGSCAFFTAQKYPVGSRMLPMGYAAILTLLSGLFLIQSIFRPSSGKTAAASVEKTESLSRVIMVSTFIVIYIVLIPVMGFYFATACFLLFFMMATKAARFLTALAVSAVTICALFAFFNLLLKLQTPSGILF